MKRLTSIAILSVCLAACGGGGLEGASEDAYYNAEIQAVSPSPSAAQFREAGDYAPETPEPSPVPNETDTQFIAYTYGLGVEFPKDSVEPGLQAHVAACEAAGPRVCIVTNSSVNNQSDDYTNAYLSLRAKPDWIESFLSGIDAEVAAADGAVTQRNKQSVDLTRDILDMDARLNAKITLKGRLEDLLATREGGLADLLQVERELARVTGEIESITSNLKALRLRVSMSEMSISYSTKRSLVSGGRGNPLATAFGDFFYNMAEALAAVITFFAVGLPWMILTGIFLLIWLRGIWPRIRKTKM